MLEAVDNIDNPAVVCCTAGVQRYTYLNLKINLSSVK